MIELCHTSRGFSWSQTWNLLSVRNWRGVDYVMLLYTLSIHICLIMSYLCTTRVVGSWLRTAKKKKWSFSSQILAIFLDVLTSLLLVLKQNGLKFLGCLIDAALAPYIIICQKNSSLKYANFTPSLVHCILKHELYIGSIWKENGACNSAKKCSYSSHINYLLRNKYICICGFIIVRIYLSQYRKM